MIDRRISVLPPRFGYYFGRDELAPATSPRTRSRFRLRSSTSSIGVRTLSLIYDGGTTAIYGPATVAAGPREP